jgi:hypothetical protein
MNPFFEADFTVIRIDGNESMRSLQRKAAQPEGHVPIIDPNPRGGEKIPSAPAEAQRFKERAPVNA